VKDLLEIAASLKACRKYIEDDVYAQLEQAQHQAVLFSTEIPPSQVLMDFSHSLLLEKAFRLPMECTVFSFVKPTTGTKILVLCFDRHVDGEPYEMRGAVFVRTQLIRDTLNFFVPSALIRLKGTEGEIAYLIEPLKISGSQKANVNIQDEDLAKECVHWGSVGLAVVQSSVAALASKDVISETVAAPHKLNKARLARGLAPLVEYRTIKLSPGAVAHCKLLSLEDSVSRNPVKLHWRRGHVRRITSGRMVPVAPCIVGSAAVGSVIKNYRLS
jgi:hypothetical protein